MADENILLSTLWNQYEKIKFGDNESNIDFNKYAPVDPLNGQISFTGCVNTAMGQIVYYFLENDLLPDFNLSLNELDDFVSNGNDIRRAITIVQNGGGAAATPAFSVINDLLTFVAAPTDPQAADYAEKTDAAAEFVAALNFACGVINHSMYSYTTGTGAFFPVDVWKRCGFTSFMATNLFSQEEQTRWVTVSVENGEITTQLSDETYEIFIENLTAGRPVSLGIPGHAVVLDGYYQDENGNDMFHVNFGWGDEGGAGGQEGTAKSTKWYNREEFAALNVMLFHSELIGSHVEEFTVTDSRFYGTGTFLRALEQANAMAGYNVISFTADTADSAVEIPYMYKFVGDILIRDFNITVAGTDESTVTAEGQKPFILFAGDGTSKVRFENFNGSAVAKIGSAPGSTIFDFSEAIQTELFFSGANFYSGKHESDPRYDEILQAVAENAETLANATEKANVMTASDGDDTIKFDQNSIAVGNIDLGGGHNKLIFAGNSQLFGDISGSGTNSIFIDSTACITGALLNDADLFFDIGSAADFALIEITGNAEETFQNISAITVDATDATTGEYLLFSWDSESYGFLENLQYEILGDAELAENENGIVLTVGEENAPLVLEDEWNISASFDGSIVSLNWNSFENVSGYSLRYARDENALAGSNIDTGANNASIILNNGTWCFQIRAIDENGTHSDWSAVTEVIIDNNNECVTDFYLANGKVADKTVDTAFKVLSGGVVENMTVSGKLILESGSTATGSLTIQDNAVVEVFSGAEFIFDVSSFETANTGGLINNFAAINGMLRFGITVSESQAEGKYILAENMENWDPSADIQLKANGVVLGTFDDETTEFFYNDKVYSLYFSSEEKQLQFVVESAMDTETKEDGTIDLSWNAPHGASGYVVEISGDDFASTLQITTVKNQLHIATPLSDSYSWRSMTVGYDQDFTCGGEIQGGTAAEGSAVYSGSQDENVTNIFFAKSDSVWGRYYIARHAALTEEQLGRDNSVVLHGKKRYQDIFQGGGESSNILYLSDDNCGDAFFTDDIYSAFPDEESRIRFSQITEIYAGAGDDVLDMTSARYESANNDIILHGGDGNDVIWADSQGCYLGDAGNDFIVGSSGTDHIAGGSGDDILHGGGGNDYFLYSTAFEWGDDSIYQLDGGSINLVFFENVNFADDSFTKEYDENNKLVKISHANGSITFYGDVTLTTNTLRHYDKSDEAIAFGGFYANSSGKIFNDNTNGVLA